MTVILTVLLADSIIHASDRLVTTKDQNGSIEHDPTANKSIIYVGEDCRLVLGYTGPAYVGNVPTDAWIAGLLSGQELPQQIRFGGRQPLGPQLAESVLKLLSERLPPRVTVSVGGYKRSSVGEEEPMIWTVKLGELSRDYDPDSPREYIYGTLVPPDWQTNDDMQALLNDLGTAAPKDQDAVLVQGIRRIAGHSPAVGGDVMVVEVASEQRWIGASLHVQRDSDDNHVPFLFSPAAVFPGTVLAPMQLSAASVRMVIQRGEISFGPIEDPEKDCVLHLNVDQPVGGVSFTEHVRAMPPEMWWPSKPEAAPADGDSVDPAAKRIRG